MGMEFFLTAFDPSDLPAGSVDPLGFERGYLMLADKILPGMTTAANRPRYFSILCLGIDLAGDLSGASPKRQRETRRKCVLRLERLWALANVLADEANDNDGNSLSGLRGVTYARARLARLHERKEKRVDHDFPFLARQVQYGCLGIYGAVATEMGFIDGKALELTPYIGHPLALGFRKTTGLPGKVVKAVCEDTPVTVSTLKAWGERAHINKAVSSEESRCLGEALNLDPIRSRMVHILAKHPFLGSGRDSELARLARIYRALKGKPADADLGESVRAILAYEKSYRWSMLAMERLLWLCRQSQAGSVKIDDLASDEVISLICDHLPRSVARLLRFLDTAETEHFRIDLTRLSDVRAYLERSANLCNNRSAFLKEVIARHADVQRGKFDKGRPKMPWLEFVSGQRVGLTFTKAGGHREEVTRRSAIAPHPYRLGSADALRMAGGS